MAYNCCLIAFKVYFVQCVSFFITAFVSSIFFPKMRQNTCRSSSTVFRARICVRFQPKLEFSGKY